jgi:hypothetical protein
MVEADFAAPGADFDAGVERAVYAWLMDHPISLGDAFERAVRAGVEAATYEWLCHHEAEVLDAIAIGAKNHESV